MTLLHRIVGFFIAIPARIQGAKIGHNTFLAPGYDFWFTDMHGVEIGNDIFIGKNAWIQTIPEKGQPQIIIDDRTFIGRNCSFTAVGDSQIKIGKKCIISFNVTIAAHEHNLFDPKKAPTDSGYITGYKTVIGDECFIGAHSFIMKGVILGKHCVVGANSVVTKSFPANSVIAGSPAKLLRKLK